MSGSIKSQVLYACHDLGVFQYLIEEGGAQARDAASACSCDEGTWCL
jgi:hypothetical protein